jgi:hypothetical protein
MLSEVGACSLDLTMTMGEFPWCVMKGSQKHFFRVKNILFLNDFGEKVKSTYIKLTKMLEIRREINETILN